jgi:hypothetical protein
MAAASNLASIGAPLTGKFWLGARIVVTSAIIYC